MKGTLFVLTGPSGVGKTSVARELLAREERLRRVITYTTRSSRPGEVDGRDYHFVSRSEFERMVAVGEMLEWADVYGHLYGQTIADVERTLGEGHDVLLVLDPQGAKTIMESGRGAVSFFLDAPDEEILGRLKGRETDTEEVIERRARALAFDRSHASFCSHRIQNTEGKMAEAVEAISGIMYNDRAL